MGDKRGQHVVPSAGGWSVRKAGSTKATRTFTNQQDAVNAAIEIARKQRGEVYIHGRDGRIRERTSYGNDPRPSRG